MVFLALARRQSDGIRRRVIIDRDPGLITNRDRGGITSLVIPQIGRLGDTVRPRIKIAERVGPV